MHAVPDAERTGLPMRHGTHGLDVQSIPVPRCATVRSQDRLRAVRASGLATCLSVESWRKLVELAAQGAQAPNAMVTVVEADRQVLVSRSGGVRDAKRTFPLTHSLCRYVVERDAPLVVGDTHAVPGLREEPAVAELGVAAYAGFPIRTPDGHVIGALCVTDVRARTWSTQVTETIAELAAAAEREVASRLRHRAADPTGSDAGWSWTPWGLALLVVGANGALTARELPAAACPERVEEVDSSMAWWSRQVDHVVRGRERQRECSDGSSD